jgi:hypothetical protein
MLESTAETGPDHGAGIDRSGGGGSAWILVHLSVPVLRAVLLDRCSRRWTVLRAGGPDCGLVRCSGVRPGA